MPMNSATNRARGLAMRLDQSPDLNAEPTHETLRLLRDEANAEGASASTLTAIDDALAEFANIWDPAATGSHSDARRLTADAVKAVSEEFDAARQVYQLDESR